MFQIFEEFECLGHSATRLFRICDRTTRAVKRVREVYGVLFVYLHCKYDAITSMDSWQVNMWKRKKELVRLL